MRWRFVTVSIVATAALTAGLALTVQLSEASAAPVPTSPFKAHVDIKTFMEHVITPAAKVIWRVNGTVIDANGEHDLSPKTDADWEQIVTGAATLAEATNALLIPERVRDPAWTRHAQRLAAAADKAYRGAEAHDLKAVSEVSDSLDELCAACHRQYGLE
jgi:hypothetical protein